MPAQPYINDAPQKTRLNDFLNFAESRFVATLLEWNGISTLFLAHGDQSIHVGAGESNGFFHDNVFVVLECQQRMFGMEGVWCSHHYEFNLGVGQHILERMGSVTTQGVGHLLLTRPISVNHGYDLKLLRPIAKSRTMNTPAASPQARYANLDARICAHVRKLSNAYLIRNGQLHYAFALMSVLASVVFASAASIVADRHHILPQNLHAAR
jgi:hypothetical protein